jgi:putative ABC transport system ATP-binding protein
MVTHDLKTAARGERILYLRDGAVSGELPLPPYDSGESASRIDKLSRFLDSMGW